MDKDILKVIKRITQMPDISPEAREKIISSICFCLVEDENNDEDFNP